MSACRIPTHTDGFDRTHLVEKHILAIAALGREILEVAVRTDAVLQAQLLPELAPD